MENFWVDLASIALKLAKHYLDQNHLIPMIGKHEAVNISEFQSTDAFNHVVKLEPRNDDMDAQMGKQLMINHSGGESLKTNTHKDNIVNLFQFPFPFMKFRFKKIPLFLHGF